MWKTCFLEDRGVRSWKSITESFMWTRKLWRILTGAALEKVRVDQELTSLRYRKMTWSLKSAARGGIVWTQSFKVCKGWKLGREKGQWFAPSLGTRGLVLPPSSATERIAKDAGEETITFDKAVGKEISSGERNCSWNEEREVLKRAWGSRVMTLSSRTNTRKGLWVGSGWVV